MQRPERPRDRPSSCSIRAPVSFHCLHGDDGIRVEAMVAEVTDTPWGERHDYVMVREGP
ncbi:MAG: DUF1365 family protein [Solirubrobacterales bacterium]